MKRVDRPESDSVLPVATIESRDESKASALVALGLDRLGGQGIAFRLALAGLALATIGCFLPWTNPETAGTRVFGFASDEGKVFLLLVAVAAIALWRHAQDREPIRLVVAWIAAAGLLLGSIDMFVTLETVEQGLTAALVDADGEVPDSEIQTTIGLWVVVAGAALAFGALVAAMMDVVKSAQGERVQADETPLPPPD